VSDDDLDHEDDDFDDFGDEEEVRRVRHLQNQAIQLCLAATVPIGLVTSGQYLRYVKPGMRPWLMVAGVVLAILAIGRIVEALLAERRAVREPELEFERDAQTEPEPLVPAAAPADDGHHHGGGNLPWLLVLPFLAVVFVAPAPLGAYSAGRQAARTAPQSEQAAAASFPPLPGPVDGAHELTLIEFTERAFYDPERPLEDVTVRLSGFVAPVDDDDADDTDFLLTRFILACCAADGIPIQVRIIDAPRPLPATDTWLVVEGRWRPGPDPYEDDDALPVLEVTSAHEIPMPDSPYEN
jgi:uncharacterized repeat protein (TIGR03943 family)